MAAQRAHSRSRLLGALLLAVLMMAAIYAYAEIVALRRSWLGPGIQRPAGGESPRAPSGLQIISEPTTAPDK